MATNESSVPIVGADLVLKATLKGFGGQEVFAKTITIFTAPTELPAKAEGKLFDDTSVPINGRIALELTLKRGSPLSLFQIEDELPVRRLDRHIGSVYNWFQGAIHHIPIVGKPLDDLLPDANQFNRVEYSVNISMDRELTYRLDVFDSAEPKPVLSYEGSHKL